MGIRENSIPAEGTTDTKALRQGQARLLKAARLDVVLPGAFLGDGGLPSSKEEQVSRLCCFLPPITSLWLLCMPLGGMPPPLPNLDGRYRSGRLD